MATATVVKNWTTYTVSWWSANDPITLKDLIEATNSGLAKLLRNTWKTTTAEEHKYVFDSDSYVDLSNARVFLENAWNNQNLDFRFNWNVKVGADDDYLSDCEIHFWPYDSWEYSNNSFPVFWQWDDATVVCPNPKNRIKIMSHLEHSSNSGEPWARNWVWLQNNKTWNKIRVSILWASFTFGSSYQLPDPNWFKPNGTMIVNWIIGPNVEVRDIEFRDGYVDWRPKNNWEAPTKWVFVSETWMKFLWSKNFTYENPLIFWNPNEAFEVVVWNSWQSWSYFLHWLYTSNSWNKWKIVYNNFKWLTWSTQMALYGGWDKIRVENHIQLSYKIIDWFALPIEWVIITVYKKDPVYNDNNNDINFTADAEFETITDTTGEWNIWNWDWSLANNICVEAFWRYWTWWNVDGAYANKDHDKADYAFNREIQISYQKWWKISIIKQSYTLSLSWESWEWKQGVWVVQLSTDLNLTALTEADVETIITDAQSLYNNVYKYSFNNKIVNLVEKEWNTIKSQYNILIDKNASDNVSFDWTTITIKADTIKSDFNLSGWAVVDVANWAVVDWNIIDWRWDSIVNVKTPYWYNDDIEVYASLEDAKNQQNLLATWSSFKYFASQTWWTELWYRMTASDWSFIIENYLLPTEPWIYDVNLITSDTENSLAEIKWALNKLVVEQKTEHQILNNNIKKASMSIPASEDITT